MKTITIGLAAVLLLAIAGCSSEPPAPKAEVARIAVPAQATTQIGTAYASFPVEVSLTPVQAAHNEAVRADIATTRWQWTNPSPLPEWVTAEYKEFEARDYTLRKAAFQRSIGWGVGVYEGKEFYWFAHTDTDANMQFDFSVALAQAHVNKIRGNESEGAKHWGVELPKGESFYLKGAKTWVADSHIWIDARCTSDYQTCYIEGALADSVATLNRDAPELELVIKGSFPW